MLGPIRQLLPAPDPTSSAHPFSVYTDAPRPRTAERPWVMANMVAGIDGAAAIGGRVGSLASATDRDLFMLLRSLADVVLVGASTVRAERYGPVRLSSRTQAERTSRGQTAIPAIAILSRSLDLDPTLPVFRSAPRPTIVTGAMAPAAAVDQLKDRADIVTVGVSATVDLRAALETLRSFGHSLVLTEGGPVLLGELISLGLLDELCLTRAPLIGGDDLPIVHALPDRALVRFRLASVLEESNHLFIRYLSDGRQ